MNYQKELKQIVCYLCVGAGATLVEWVVFYLQTQVWAIHYAFATTLAFVISTFANWFFGRIVLFRASDGGLVQELIRIYLASVIGLVLNLIIMFALVDKLSCDEMLSKIVATGLVFFWNYGIRRMFIYKKQI